MLLERVPIGCNRHCEFRPPLRAISVNETNAIRMPVRLRPRSCLLWLTFVYFVVNIDHKGHEVPTKARKKYEEVGRMLITEEDQQLILLFLFSSPPAARGRPAVNENGGFLGSLGPGESYFLSRSEATKQSTLAPCGLMDCFPRALRPGVPRNDEAGFVSSGHTLMDRRRGHHRRSPSGLRVEPLKRRTRRGHGAHGSGGRSFVGPAVSPNARRS